ncbi:carboxypeptidase N subunit 2-like [Arapaima gigas]
MSTFCSKNQVNMSLESYAFLLLIFFLPTVFANQSPDELNRTVYDANTTQIPDTLKPGITEFFFINSKITTIPSRAFVSNPQLEKIEFMSSSVSSIELGAFEGLDNLKNNTYYKTGHNKTDHHTPDHHTADHHTANHNTDHKTSCHPVNRYTKRNIHFFAYYQCHNCYGGQF